MARKNVWLVLFVLLVAIQVSCSDDDKPATDVKPNACVWDGSTWDSCTWGS